ncbi:SDR family NAD(P)-dependent oxidoreductase [Streptomyces sp. S1D4-11]|nr:SDR family NAD(P)-dependent oxidoreductase [Streptomyces sp. S1D4-11]QIY93981.1 SDR family NAD(P)-dependent oxidoreductase [Streptomyces sp. S1D4-11]
MTTTQTSVSPLSGRVAVVTGASSGMGEASAEHLAALGAHVVVLARRVDRLSDVVARREKNGGRALALAVDVADAAAVQSAADQVAAELGGADLLFNNAGVILFNPAEAPAVGSWQREIDISALTAQVRRVGGRSGWTGGDVRCDAWAAS